MLGDRLPVGWLCHPESNREASDAEKQAMQSSARQLARASWVQEQENHTCAMLHPS